MKKWNLDIGLTAFIGLRQSHGEVLLHSPSPLGRGQDAGGNYVPQCHADVYTHKGIQVRSEVLVPGRKFNGVWCWSCTIFISTKMKSDNNNNNINFIIISSLYLSAMRFTLSRTTGTHTGRSSTRSGCRREAVGTGGITEEGVSRCPRQLSANLNSHTPKALTQRYIGYITGTLHFNGPMH